MQVEDRELTPQPMEIQADRPQLRLEDGPQPQGQAQALPPEQQPRGSEQQRNIVRARRTLPQQAPDAVHDQARLPSQQAQPAPLQVRGDSPMRGYRRGPSTIVDHAMPGQERIRRLDQDDFPERDRQAQALQRILGQADDMGVQPFGDVPMGLICSIELPHGIHLPTGVNLD